MVDIFLLRFYLLATYQPFASPLYEVLEGTLLHGLGLKLLVWRNYFSLFIYILEFTFIQEITAIATIALFFQFFDITKKQLKRFIITFLLFLKKFCR